MKKIYWGLLLSCCILLILVMGIVLNVKKKNCDSLAYDLIHTPLPCYNVTDTDLDNNKNDGFIFNTRDDVINFDKEYGTSISKNIMDNFIGKNLVLIKVNWENKVNGSAYKIDCISYKDNVISIDLKPKREKITINSNDKNIVYNYFLLIEMDDSTINNKTTLEIAIK